MNTPNQLGSRVIQRLLLLGLIGLLIWSTPPSWSQAPSPARLTLEQALQQAFQQSPHAHAERARLEVLEADITTAKARPNPIALTDAGVAEQTYRVGIEQTFELGGKRKHRTALALALRDAEQAEIQAALLDLRAQVRQAYVTLFNLEERRATLDNIVKVAEELVLIAKKRERAGDISVLEVLQTEIIRVNAQNELQTLAFERHNAKTTLNTLLNQPLQTEWLLQAPNGMPKTTAITPPETHTAPEQGHALDSTVLHGEISATPLDLEQLTRQAIRQRPELQKIKHQLGAARQQERVAKAERIPNLALAIGPEYVAESGDHRVRVFVAGAMGIPVFNRQQGPIAAAQAQQNRLEHQSQALENQIRQEVSRAYHAFQAHQDRITRYETELLPLSVTITDKSRRAFQEGKLSILTPIQAQQAYMTTRLGYLQALADLQSAISDLERAIGAGL